MSSSNDSNATTAATTTTAVTATAATALKSRFDDYANRGQTVAEALQAAIPVTASTPAQQEAFMSALSDLQLLKTLLPGAQSSLNGLNLSSASPEEIAQAGDFVAAMAELAKDLIETVSETFGVAPDLVIPAAIKQLTTLLDLIETIVVRAESNLAAMTA
ncbi:MAG: hypothetical protein JST01_25545 [Cyanobacteria bacterium SZAS TMP-1]|nr:hypothetical protein [Cyanobacteria bacterium SZAS TMP-1]